MRPCASPVVVLLTRLSYYLCEKTDGIRCLLYLTFSPDGDKSIETHMLIDRKNDYYEINNAHLHFPLPDQPVESFHIETVLDGELVMDTLPNGEKRKTYLVFDCLAIDGKVLTKRTFDKRMGYLAESVIKPYHRLLEQYPQEKAEQPFIVMCKKQEKAYGIEMMFRDTLPNLPHGNDGLIFTCRTSPYVTGTDEHIMKWKPPHENTIDFRLQLGDFPMVEQDGERFPDFDGCPTFTLLVYHGNNKNVVFAPLYVTDQEWECMKGMGQILDGRIIECYKDDEGRWRMKRETDGTPRFRDDKTEANHISTVESVLESIEDAVTEQDLRDHAKAINVQWKRREAQEKSKLGQQQQQQQQQ